MNEAPIDLTGKRRGTLRFCLDDVQAASDAWGFNCGPGALCAVLGKTPDEIRPCLQNFEKKGYTNPKLMADILRDLSVPFRRVFEQTGHVRRNGIQTPRYPRFGLVRIQWDGPWCNPGVPIRAAYRHTHWIGFQKTGADGRGLAFDVNAMCVGGWIPWDEWADQLVPWLLGQIATKATGGWWPTHSWDLPLVVHEPEHAGSAF